MCAPAMMKNVAGWWGGKWKQRRGKKKRETFWLLWVGGVYKSDFNGGRADVGAQRRRLIERKQCLGWVQGPRLCRAARTGRRDKCLGGGAAALAFYSSWDVCDFARDGDVTVKGCGNVT